MGLNFAEFATSLKWPKIDTAKNKPYHIGMSSLKVLEIAKIGLGENLTHLPSVIFAKFPGAKKNSRYTVLSIWHFLPSKQDLFEEI